MLKNAVKIFLERRFRSFYVKLDFAHFRPECLVYLSSDVRLTVERPRTNRQDIRAENVQSRVKLFALMDTQTLPEMKEDGDKSSPFVNCIRKNYRHLRKWAQRTETNCFRIYDREINHYPLAIDFYAGRYCVHYFAHPKEDALRFSKLQEEVIGALSRLLRADLSKIYWRTRIKRERGEQYEKADVSQDFFTVLEYGVKFRVNLIDYLDTGLFLDHRETRRWVATHSKGKRLLNLFSYTGSFSVHAALGGALFTKSVDMSNTYSEWARSNFILNGLSSKQNEVVRADCLKFLDEEMTSSRRYDLIIIDPPTLSRSKKMDQLFDIQIDYVGLIKRALMLLSQGGVILFSTNSRGFVFDKELFPFCSVINISSKTLPLDFHDPYIHRCWKLQI